MKNNRGFMKYELATIILLVLVVFAFLFYSFLGGASKHKLKVMKESAISFRDSIATNIESFHNLNTVYLAEAKEEGVLKDIKNPVGIGSCDETESKVRFKDGNVFVTLRCGDYLIDDQKVKDEESIKIYKVSNWKEEKSTGMEKRKLYNCKKNNKLVYDEYYEELYFVSRINKDNNKKYYFASDIAKEDCKVVTKTFYREKEEYEK